MEAAVPKVSQAPRRYLYELAAAIALYMAALFGRVHLVAYTGDPALKAAILLSPILGIMLVVLAVYRFYRRVDEFFRLRMLKVGAISGGITAAAAASWSFLEDVGAPPLTNFGALMVFAGIASLTAFLYRVEDAVSEHRIGRIGRGISWISAFAASGAGLWLAVASTMGLPWVLPLGVLIVAAGALVVMSLGIGPSMGPV